MCDYCEGKKPLTDKIYDDGTEFNDALSTRIEFIGNIPVIISEYKTKNFNWPFCDVLSKEQKTLLAKKWAVEIEYCPRCGKKLG